MQISDMLDGIPIALVEGEDVDLDEISVGKLGRLSEVGLQSITNP